MRDINKIIIHCSATKADSDIGAKEIDSWHKKQGFSSIGYHFVICRNGDIEAGRPVQEMGAHCKGQNANSIGICLIGGIDENGKSQNNFTDKQFQCLKLLVKKLQNEFPNSTIHGHYEFANKDCPCFNVKEFFTQ